MMTISALPAPPPEAAIATSGPDVTVTTALTSRPPSGRYWFWSTSMAKPEPESVMRESPWLRRRPHEGERDQHDGDVVHAAGPQGELQQRVGGAGRVVERVRERELGQGRRLGPVVPQPVGADQHDPAAGRLEPGHVRLGRGHVGAEPAGDHVRLR